MFAVTLQLHDEDADRVDAWLETSETQAMSFRDVENGTLCVQMFCDDGETAQSEAVRLERALGASGCRSVGPATVVPLPDTDWQEAWKSYFHAARVSEHVVVGPPWEQAEVPAGCIAVTIDPGMSFGTGLHESTRGCLRMLDRIAGERRGLTFCDVGCGSGILSIVARKLGFGRTLALDEDTDAVRTARRNGGDNGVDGIEFGVCDVRQAGPEAVFDVVVANMLAELLLETAVNVARLVKPSPGSYLVLAGTLDEQWDEVLGVYRDLGFRQVDRESLSGWTTGLLTRAAGDQS